MKCSTYLDPVTVGVLQNIPFMIHFEEILRRFSD